MPSQKLRVLVVDDERVIADTLALIVSQSGHETLAVYSGVEAMEEAERFNPHIVISDVVMPGLDGVELAQHLTASHRDCRVLLISGHTDGGRIASLVSQGHSVRFLSKPVLPQTILAFIAEYRGPE